MTTQRMMGLLHKHYQTIRRHGVKTIGVFGSYARGEQTTASDIDVVIEFEEGKKSFDNYMDLKFFLENIFRRKVDLVIKTTIKPSLKKFILQDIRYVA